MMPLLLKMTVPREDRKPLSLFFPVFWVWPLLLLIILAFSPLVLVIALLTWQNGTGRSLLAMGPALLSVVWHLSGLTIDVDSAETQFYLSFV